MDGKQIPPGRYLADALALFPHGNILGGIIYDLLPILAVPQSEMGGAVGEVQAITKAARFVGETLTEHYGWKVGTVLLDPDDGETQASAVVSLMRGSQRFTLSVECKKEEMTW